MLFFVSLMFGRVSQEQKRKISDEVCRTVFSEVLGNVNERFVQFLAFDSIQAQRKVKAVCE